MAIEANQETFGSYLKGFRLERNMAIETVAANTKIATHCLAAMELNDHGRLPPRAYVKSFIRAYADAVGANADVALDLYLSDLERQATARQQILKRRAKLGTLRRTLVAGGAIGIILLLVRYGDLFLGTGPSSDTSESEHTALPGSTTARVEMDPSHPTTPQQRLKLRVVAVEPTWLKVIVDGQNTRSYDLKPEDRLELEGTNNFNLMLGNATGLNIFLNEHPVKIFGSSGQVVSLKIP